MARYELIAKDKITNKEYIIQLKNQKTNKTNKKNDLFEIDALTSRYKTVDELSKALVQNACIPRDFVDLKIRYYHNKEEKYLDVIVNDSMIYHTCIRLIHKKNGKIKPEVDVNNDMNAFYHKVLSYMSDKETSEILLQNDYKLIPYLIYKDILNYQRLCQKSFLTKVDEKEKRQIEEHTFSELKRYKNLRGFYIWHKLFEQGKIKKRRKKIIEELNTFKESEISLYRKEGYKTQEISEEELIFDEKELKSFTYGDEGSQYEFRKK